MAQPQRRLRFKSASTEPTGGTYMPGSAPVVTGEPALLGESGEMGSRSTLIPEPRPLRELRFKNLPPEMRDAPELRPSGVFDILPDRPGMATAVSALGPLTFNAEEYSSILKSVEPRLQITRGPEGGIYVKHPDVDQTYVINRPGVSPNDLVQIGTAILSAAPAGRAGTVIGRAAAEAAIQTAIEVAQSKMGGEFNVEEPLMSGGFSVLADVPGVVSRARSGQLAGREAERQGAREAAPAIRDVATATVQPPEMAAQTLESVVRPDPGMQRSVTELGLESVAPTRIVSTNEQYRQVEEALSKIPGTAMANSEKEFITELSSRTGQFIDDFGGSRSIIDVDQNLKTQIINDVNDLRSQSDSIYDALSESISPRTKIRDVSSLRGDLLRRARDLGGIGNLSQPEQRVLKELKRAVRGRGLNYARIDELRKEIGAGLRSSQGPFADAATFQLSRLYDGLTSLQDTALRNIDPSLASQWDLAKSLVSQRKALEEATTAVAGKELQRDIIPQLSRALSRLSSGSAADFNRVINAIPEYLREEAIVTAMGSIFTGGGRTATELVPGSYASWWKKVTRDAGARRILFKNLPEGSPRFLNNLAKVADSYASVRASVPSTGIIKSMEQFNNDKGFIHKIVGMIPVPGTNKLSQIFSYGLKAPDTLEAATDLMASSPFKRIINRKFAGESTERAEEAFSKTKVYLDWLNSIPAVQRERILVVGLTDYLFGDE